METTNDTRLSQLPAAGEIDTRVSPAWTLHRLKILRRCDVPARVLPGEAILELDLVVVGEPDALFAAIAEAKARADQALALAVGEFHKGAKEMSRLRELRAAAVRRAEEIKAMQTRLAQAEKRRDLAMFEGQETALARFEQLADGPLP